MPDEEETKELTVTTAIMFQPSTAAGEAAMMMNTAGLPLDDLAQALVDGLTPRAYARARLLGHTPEEIRTYPELRDQNGHLVWRENYGLSFEEARDLQDRFRTSPNQELMKKLYKAVRAAGRGHDHAVVVAMLADEPILVPGGQRDPVTYRLRSTIGMDRWREVSQKARLQLHTFYTKALEASPDVELNEVWRAWLVDAGLEPYDVQGLIWADSGARS